ncbi:MAG: hypothetical protein Q8R28_15050 [Dehalococcoidia bacterium]|nr:hypothetical protein [Dehalococcoidia bacterium]
MTIASELASYWDKIDPQTKYEPARLAYMLGQAKRDIRLLAALADGSAQMTESVVEYLKANADLYQNPRQQ